MKFKIFKDKKQRFLTNNLEKNRKILLFLISNQSILNKNIKYTAKILLNQLNNYSIKNRIKNRCILTGNSKSISRKYKLSRISLKNLIFIHTFSEISKYNW